jgi:hypothetical protein
VARPASCGKTSTVRGCHAGERGILPAVFPPRDTRRA